MRPFYDFKNLQYAEKYRQHDHKIPDQSDNYPHHNKHAIPMWITF